jgi:hypothetical protein
MSQASRKPSEDKLETLEVKPESRIPPMVIGGTLMPLGLFIYGWTAEKKVRGFRVTISTIFIKFQC